MHPALDVEAVDGVIIADLGPVDLVEGEADWTDRDISGADFRRWLLTHAGACRIGVGGARVLGSGTGGSLDLTDLRVPAALVLRDCRVEPLIDLGHAEVGRLEFDGCELPGGVRLDGAKVRGGVRIAGGSRLGSVEGVSVAGSNATIEGSVEVEGEGTRLEGGLRLAGVGVGGQLAIGGGAQVAADQTGLAVDADGLTVTQDLFVDGEGTRLEGSLRLAGSSVGGQLAIRGGAQVAADVVLEAAKVAVLAVRSCRVEGTLELSHARLGRLDHEELQDGQEPLARRAGVVGRTRLPAEPLTRRTIPTFETVVPVIEFGQRDAAVADPGGPWLAAATVRDHSPTAAVP